MTASKKSFIGGIAVGMTLLLGVEIISLVVGAHFYAKATERRVAANLPAPAIPEALDADYGLTLTARDGATVRLDTLKGKVIFLHFWSAGCGVCLAEMPTLQRLAAEVKDDGVAFVFAAVRNEDTTWDVADEYGPEMPVYALTEKRPACYGNRVPATYIITADGKLAFSQRGPADWEAESVTAYLRDLAMRTHVTDTQ